jgi:hypothetical protein
MQTQEMEEKNKPQLFWKFTSNHIPTHVFREMPP